VFLLVLGKMVSLFENGVFWLECANVSKRVENFAFSQDLLKGVQILQT